jgi:hypothetical protein
MNEATTTRAKLSELGTKAGLPVVLLAGLAFFAWFTHRHEPWQTWLFWRYAGYWIACLYWGLGCLSTGTAILRRMLPGELPLREQLATGFALGVFVYTFASSLLGLAHVYGAWFFFGAPLVMIAVGARGLYTTLRRLRRHLVQARRTASPSPWYVLPVLAFGLLGLGMVYFLILTPENVQFDSRWKHFALAEQYAVTGGIRRFPEGWTVATNPHLATHVYLWGFLLPFGKLFDRVELAAHLEFFVFVITTFSISALVRRLVPGLRARHTWVARFLFPGVFLYDSSLSGGADHIAALFTVPMFLLVLRGYRELSWRHTSLVAVMVAGAALTKLTCLLMFVPVAAVVYAVRTVSLAWRPPPGVPRYRALVGPLVAIGVGLVATSGFWAKNWAMYGDPVYPSLYKHLSLRPWHEDAADLFVWGYQDYQFWRPSRDLKGIGETLLALVDFSFDPNDYKKFHGKVPVFGSLFTLLLPALLFHARRAKRAWGLVASVHVAIAVWYWVHHQDRYLQALMPWMAATTAVSLLLVWRSGLPARAAVSLLVGYQIVWGADVYFIPTHAMATSSLKKSVDLLAGTFKKDAKRLETYPRWVQLGESIPKGSRVLLHDNHVHLGLGHSTVSDWGGWQFGMSYARHPTPSQTWSLLRDMGTTHIVWENEKSQGWDSIAGDLVFFHFASRIAESKKRVGNFLVATMPREAPTEPGLEKVLFHGCGKPLATGLYDLADLHIPVFGPKRAEFPSPRKTGDVSELAGLADAIVLEQRCHASPPSSAQSEFERVAKRRALLEFKRSKELTIWLRRGGSAPVGSGSAADPSDSGDDGDGLDDDPTAPEPQP